MPWPTVIPTALIFSGAKMSLLLRQERFLGYTETIQFKQRELEIPLPFIPNSVLCPVTALNRYLCTVPNLPSSPLFIVNQDGSFRPLLAAHFNRLFKACINTARTFFIA